jgi:hypothetical protein
MEGGAKTRRGDLITGDFSPYHLIAQALGFSHKPTVMRAERNEYIKEIESSVEGKATKLLDRLYLSQRTYDTTTYFDTLNDIYSLNLQFPQLGLTTRSIRRRVKARDRISDEKYYGLSIRKRWRDTLIPRAEELELGTEVNFFKLFD